MAKPVKLADLGQRDTYMTLVQQFYDRNLTKVICVNLRRVLMSYGASEIASKKQTHESILKITRLCWDAVKSFVGTSQNSDIMTFSARCSSRHATVRPHKADNKVSRH
jgi:hypothetical protein